MTAPDQSAHVVEVEFDISDTDFFLVEASKRTECELELHEILRKSDDSVLEFFSVRGANVERLLALASDVPTIREMRLLKQNDREALFSCVSSSEVATTLADRDVRVVDIVVTAGDGRLVAEVPSHVSATSVIDSFLETYPGSELLSRKETDRKAPLFTRTQAESLLLSDLTDKQLEAIRVAHASGYYEWPRETTVGELADELDVASSTVSQHLRIAELKLLDRIFDR